MWRSIAEGKQGKVFFFEKKKQKTFSSLSRTSRQHVSEKLKVFWFFFSKKNIFLLVYVGTADERRGDAN
jgi:hypothetical protein